MKPPSAWPGVGVLTFWKVSGRNWLAGKGIVPNNPEGSVVGFVKAYVEKHGSAR